MKPERKTVLSIIFAWALMFLIYATISLGMSNDDKAEVRHSRKRIDKKVDFILTI